MKIIKALSLVLLFSTSKASNNENPAREIARIFFKEPMRIFRFYVATGVLEAEGHKIPVGFKITTTARFVGRFIANVSTILMTANTVAIAAGEPFIKGVPGFLLPALWFFDESLVTASRGITKAYYSEVSGLYSDLTPQTTPAAPPPTPVPVASAASVISATGNVSTSRLKRFTSVSVCNFEFPEKDE